MTSAAQDFWCQPRATVARASPYGSTGECGSTRLTNGLSVTQPAMLVCRFFHGDGSTDNLWVGSEKFQLYKR